MSDKENREESPEYSKEELMKSLAAFFLKDAEPMTATPEVEYSDEYKSEN